MSTTNEAAVSGHMEKIFNIKDPGTEVQRYGADDMKVL